jgi:hypothetical protein
MKKSTILIISIFLLTFGAVNAQQGGYEYLKETRWGINKNTSSGFIGGIMIKHSIQKEGRMYHTFGVELMNITHPNESGIRRRETGSLFKLGKQNYFYALRAQYGRDLILFKKAPQQGAQVIVMLAGGPSFGFQSPYFIALKNGRNVKYDPNNGQHRSIENIIGSGKLFQGLPESKIILGANIKLGLSFEFGIFKNAVTGFEAGFLLDAYTQEVIIMDRAENRSVFPTSFITVFWGSRK